MTVEFHAEDLCGSQGLSRRTVRCRYVKVCKYTPFSLLTGRQFHLVWDGDTFQRHVMLLDNDFSCCVVLVCSHLIVLT